MVSKQVHGTSVAIENRGVLIIGSSGSGKSDLALRLIDSGATLISDDQTECIKNKNDIFLFPNQEICGLIEVRGVGIIKVPFVKNVKLNMIVELTNKEPERIPESKKKRLLGKNIKYIKIIGTEPSASAKIKVKLLEDMIND